MVLASHKTEKWVIVPTISLKKKVQSEKVKILLFRGHSRSSIAKIFYNLCTEAAKIKEEEFKNLKRIGVRDGIFTRLPR